MIDTAKYFREMGIRARLTLVSLGCIQCKDCHVWMDKEYISEDGVCNECNQKNELFKNIVE